MANKPEVKDPRKICKVCFGSGMAVESEKACPICKGSGRVGLLAIKKVK